MMPAGKGQERPKMKNLTNPPCFSGEDAGMTRLEKGRCRRRRRLGGLGEEEEGVHGSQCHYGMLG